MNDRKVLIEKAFPNGFGYLWNKYVEDHPNKTKRLFRVAPKDLSKFHKGKGIAVTVHPDDLARFDIRNVAFVANGKVKSNVILHELGHLHETDKTGKWEIKDWRDFIREELAASMFTAEKKSRGFPPNKAACIIRDACLEYGISVNSASKELFKVLHQRGYDPSRDGRDYAVRLAKDAIKAVK